MDSPLFSIITVTLNNIDSLKKTHQSVKGQTHSDYEWIVIDGNSNDGTKEYLREHHANHISEPDDGLYDAMNKGIERATGDYLIFMNAGDIFASKETLQTINQTIGTNQPDFIHGDALEILDSHEVYKKSRAYYKINDGMVTHHQSMLYRRNKLNGLRYNLQYQIAADYDLTYRFIQMNDNVAYISTPVCLFESGGLSENNALRGRIEQFKIRRKYKMDILKNVAIFLTQTVLYALRKISPKLYWRFKDLLTRV